MYNIKLNGTLVGSLPALLYYYYQLICSPLCNNVWEYVRLNSTCIWEAFLDLLGSFVVIQFQFFIILMNYDSLLHGQTLIFLLGTLPTLSSSLLRIHITLSIIFFFFWFLIQLTRYFHNFCTIMYTFTIATVNAINVGIMALQPRGHYTCLTVK